MNTETIDTSHDVGSEKTEDIVGKHVDDTSGSCKGNCQDCADCNDSCDESDCKKDCGGGCCGGGCHEESQEESILQKMGLISGAGLEAWEKAVEEHFHMSMNSIKENITGWVSSNLDKFADEFPYLALYGDFGRFADEHDDIVKMLSAEATKIENWELAAAAVNDQYKLIQLIFGGKFAGEDDMVAGHVYFSYDGKVKHVFATNEA